LVDRHDRSCYLLRTPTTKGQRTRQSILDEALQLASVVGLDGLSIGTLAERLGLSKSGLYAHFKSKDALQLAILQRGVEHFGEIVVTPARSATDPVATIRALYEGWLEWSGHRMAGGCLFVTAAIEYDDRPGPVRDYLMGVYGRWIGLIAATADRGIAAGSFRPTLDARQFAHDFNSALLGFNQALRLLRDPDAETRARRALERLLTDATL
jgi:AcrR family transcriptional regulator